MGLGEESREYIQNGVSRAHGDEVRGPRMPKEHGAGGKWAGLVVNGVGLVVKMLWCALGPGGGPYNIIYT